MQLVNWLDLLLKLKAIGYNNSFLPEYKELQHVTQNKLVAMKSTKTVNFIARCLRILDSVSVLGMQCTYNYIYVHYYIRIIPSRIS